MEVLLYSESNVVTQLDYATENFAFYLGLPHTYIVSGVIIIIILFGDDNTTCYCGSQFKETHQGVVHGYVPLKPTYYEQSLSLVPRLSRNANMYRVEPGIFSM